MEKKNFEQQISTNSQVVQTYFKQKMRCLQAEKDNLCVESALFYATIRVTASYEYLENHFNKEDLYA